MSSSCIISICLLVLLGAVNGMFSKIIELEEVIKPKLKQLEKYTLEEIRFFDVFKKVFNKTYPNPASEHLRLLKFLSNQNEIEEHNHNYEKGRVTYLRGLWKYSDLSSDEVDSFMNGFRMPVQSRAMKEDAYDIKPPKALNWVKKGYVSTVKAQELCGSCWCFSAVGAIEGQIFKKTGQLTNLSAQNLIDCDRNDEIGNYGCKGGDMLTAFDFIIDQKGIAKEREYPYEAVDTMKCSYNKNSRTGARIVSYETIQSGHENLLKSMLAYHGPISIAVDASLATFQSYKTGVYYDKKCSKDINHAVLLCGYGHDEKTKQDYWLVKNSYGDKWGEKGYIRMARNANNHCGIAEFAIVPIC